MPVKTSILDDLVHYSYSLDDIVVVPFERRALERFIALVNDHNMRTPDGLWVRYSIEYRDNGDSAVITETTYRENPNA